ncbi:hypothetical protein P9869_02625 [Streptomyces ossamyceticus]|nr:hypothetical protein [Streptomyces ossamyceticus]
MSIAEGGGDFDEVPAALRRDSVEKWQGKPIFSLSPPGTDTPAMPSARHVASVTRNGSVNSPYKQSC